MEIGHHEHWNIFGLVFNADTLISMWFVSAVLIIFAIAINRLILKPKSLDRPGRFQCLVEMLIEFLMGVTGVKFFSFIATLFLFILFSNWLELIPLTAIYVMFFEHWLGHIPEFIPPTADLNTTAGLALFTIISVEFYGIVSKGFGYFKRFIEPNVIFLPINIMEELAKPFSLAIRLFGNIFGKETIIVILVSLVAFPIIYPLPILFLSLLIGAIQAFVFTILASIYFEEATSREH